MFRKIIYIILFCLGLLQTRAQQDSSKGSVSGSSPDTPSGKSTVNVPARNENDDNPVKPSNNPRTSTRLPIKASIQITDRKNIITAKVTVDSANKKEIPRDAGGHYLLYPDSRYMIKATAVGYNPLDTLYVAKKNVAKLILNLVKITSTDSAKTKTRTTIDSINDTIEDSTRDSTGDSIKIGPSTNGTTRDSILFIAVAVIFIISLAVVILTVKTRRGLRLINTKISDLSDQITTMKENNDNTTISQPADETSAAVPVNIIPQVNETAGTTEQSEPIINKLHTNAYFVCELMVTAGPRKDDFEDVDLGEDVCGFVSNAQEAIVWVLDGTSDADRKTRLNNSSADDEDLTLQKKSLVYFSSRLLAQSIGNKIKKNFTQKPAGPFEEIITQILNEVKDEWQTTYKELSADDKKDLEETVTHKSLIQCSTTVLIARLSITGELTAYRVGDSKMLVFENTALNGIRLVETEFQEKNEENDRIFFSFQLNKSDHSIHFISNTDRIIPNAENKKERRCATISKENISTIISFSDGIGINTQTYLKEEYKNHPELVRKEIVYQRQATEDDKSICFIEIKQTS